MSLQPYSVDMVPEAMWRIQPYIRRTILDQSIHYGQRYGADVYFKCENLQHTGSFKVRGAFNKILSLTELERSRGIVTASTGNHGAACGFAMRQIGVDGIVFVPETTIETKLAAIRKLGVKIRTYGTDSVEAERHAREFANANDMVYISPYNDPFIVGGQGTIGMELLQQLPTVDAVFVSVGGGGLIGGIGSYIKSQAPHVQIFGCSPANSQVMAESVRAGAILDLPSLPTLSDGTAGGVEAGSITFPLCQDYVDQYISVSEDEIIASLREFIGAQHQLIEGSAAVAIAAFLRIAKQLKNAEVAVVLCGANISLETLRDIL